MPENRRSSGGWPKRLLPKKAAQLMKKCLVLYASETGCTEMAALEIARRFKEQHWLVVLKKIGECRCCRESIPFEDYDFVCAGSWTRYSLPVPWIQEALRAAAIPDEKIIPGPRGALAFCTYGGEHLGAREADACLTLLEILLEHLGFRPLGSIAIQNRQGIPPADPRDYDPEVHEWPMDCEQARLHSCLDRVFGMLESTAPCTRCSWTKARRRCGCCSPGSRRRGSRIWRNSR